MTRLVLDPPHPSHGEVDGRWWPRSSDLAVELPALVLAVARRIDAVDRISLDPEAWNGRPRTVTVDGRAILLDWFGARHRHTVGLHGPDDLHLVLLVIPPDTPAVVARACLTMPAPAAAGAEHPWESRWEDDGGRTRAPRSPVSDHIT